MARRRQCVGRGLFAAVVVAALLAVGLPAVAPMPVAAAGISVTPAADSTAVDGVCSLGM